MLLGNAESSSLRAAISLKLTYSETAITVFADVVRSEPGKGMGVKFRAVEPGAIVDLKGLVLRGGPS